MLVAYAIDIKKLLLETGACKTGMEAIRLINQGAVEIDGDKVGRIALVCDGDVLHCGKRFWRKLINTDEYNLV